MYIPDPLSRSILLSFLLCQARKLGFMRGFLDYYLLIQSQKVYGHHRICY